ncbi:hypothetical protein SELMODRAFT_416685 [Selaginella moellendorffii]|uniref:Uncharacterized protein n=1 Tax=Selaginella moellendorffii TaxID=88036 RepID=D8S034_SELML|nr:hypothetical protein SELMODRAFT_416685 [Selaginella moellendorffii]
MVSSAQFCCCSSFEHRYFDAAPVFHFLFDLGCCEEKDRPRAPNLGTPERFGEDDGEQSMNKFLQKMITSTYQEDFLCNSFKGHLLALPCNVSQESPHNKDGALAFEPSQNPYEKLLPTVSFEHGVTPASKPLGFVGRVGMDFPVIQGNHDAEMLLACQTQGNSKSSQSPEQRTGWPLTSTCMNRAPWECQPGNRRKKQMLVKSSERVRLGKYRTYPPVAARLDRIHMLAEAEVQSAK